MCACSYIIRIRLVIVIIVTGEILVSLKVLYNYIIHETATKKTIIMTKMMDIVQLHIDCVHIIVAILEICIPSFIEDC